MIDNSFRKQLENFSRPLIELFVLLKLTPNVVTIVSCLTGLAAALLITKGLFITALFVWWAGRLLDGLDGILARRLGKSSSLGAFLDINADMLAYSAVIMAFNFIRPDLGIVWCSILLLYVMCISGALSLGSIQPELPNEQNRKQALASGLAEGGETGIYYSLCLLLPQHIKELSYIWIAILITTVFSRFILARRVLSERGPLIS
ncbi:CDP-alcohol phosphatidyltransferase family protein [bacterium]|nr:CDP-alcohol phosphatidyltransferase family protein [bacterium]